MRVRQQDVIYAMHENGELMRGSFVSISMNSEFSGCVHCYDYEMARRLGYKFARSGKKYSFLRVNGRRFRFGQPNVESKILSSFGRGACQFYMDSGLSPVEALKMRQEYYISSHPNRGNEGIIFAINESNIEKKRALMDLLHEVKTSYWEQYRLTTT
jgi:hypothetical protein